MLNWDEIVRRIDISVALFLIVLLLFFIFLAKFPDKKHRK